jgi:hypothetical protein
MASPCSCGLSFHSDWIVPSAPEMTTVSKPKRNPANAAVRDQKKRRGDIGRQWKRKENEPRLERQVTQRTARWQFVDLLIARTT